MTGLPSGKERLILELLEGGELYGLEMVKKSGGKLGRGTVYVTLARMEDKQYVSGREVPSPIDGMQPRRYYTLARPGKVALEAWRAARAVMRRK